MFWKKKPKNHPLADALDSIAAMQEHNYGVQRGIDMLDALTARLNRLGLKRERAGGTPTPIITFLGQGFRLDPDGISKAQEYLDRYEEHQKFHNQGKKK